MKQWISKGWFFKNSTGLPTFSASFLLITKPTKHPTASTFYGVLTFSEALSRHPGFGGPKRIDQTLRIQVCPKNAGLNLETYSIGMMIGTRKILKRSGGVWILRENKYQWNLDDSLLCWTCMHSFGEEGPTISCSSVSWIHFLTNVFEIYLWCSPLTNSNIQYPNDPCMEYLYIYHRCKPTGGKYSSPT